MNLVKDMGILMVCTERNRRTTRAIRVSSLNSLSCTLPKMPYKKRCTGRSNHLLFSTCLDEEGEICQILHISCIYEGPDIFGTSSHSCRHPVLSPNQDV